MVLIVQVIKLVQESQNGCTADQVLNLTVPKPADALLHKQSVLVNLSLGMVLIMLIKAGTRILQNGCTADQVLNLTVTPKPADAVTTQTICSGESFSWNGTDYTATTQAGTRIPSKRNC
jgi:hypothetical protein